MGFLDKAKAAANDLAAKADSKLGSAGMGGPGAARPGDANPYFRDLGVLAYLEANGRPGSGEDRERVLEALRAMEAQGAISTFALQTSAPPPPGARAAPPPPGAMTAPPPPGGTGSPPTQQTPVPPPQSAPDMPAPPPPSWMAKD